MAATTVPSIQPASPKLIAPRLHTVLLITLFLVLTVSGAFFQRQAHSRPGILQQHPNMVPLYLSVIALQWGLFYWIWKGLRRTNTKLGELIGGRWASAKDVLTDVALAAGLWGTWEVVGTAWVRWLGQGHAASIQSLLPRGPVEILLWVAVSASAGVCEEVVFRGYFQKQFAAFTGSVWIALLLQATLFGISHGYQGVVACLRIAALGVLYGLLALWRKSLRPGMIAHAGTDILSGIFGI